MERETNLQSVLFGVWFCMAVKRRKYPVVHICTKVSIRNTNDRTVIVLAAVTVCYI